MRRYPARAAATGGPERQRRHACSRGDRHRRPKHPDANANPPAHPGSYPYPGHRYADYCNACTGRHRQPEPKRNRAALNLPNALYAVDIPDHHLYGIGRHGDCHHHAHGYTDLPAINHANGRHLAGHTRRLPYGYRGHGAHPR